MLYAASVTCRPTPGLLATAYAPMDKGGSQPERTSQPAEAVPHEIRVLTEASRGGNGMQEESISRFRVVCSLQKQNILPKFFQACFAGALKFSHEWFENGICSVN